MVTSVQVTPLCGVYSESPLCYLLSVDGFNFLMDSGWNDLCDLNLVQPLSRVAPTVDAVLVSHPDVLHLGPLPYAMKHLGLSAPVYSTEPVYRLGLLTMYDHYIARRVEFAGGALRCGVYFTLRKVNDSSQKGGTGAQQVVIEGPSDGTILQDPRPSFYSQFYLL